jgi:hypothetical protein
VDLIRRKKINLSLLLLGIDSVNLGGDLRREALSSCPITFVDHSQVDSFNNLTFVKTQEQDQTSLIRALLRLEQVSSCRAIIGAEAWTSHWPCQS